MNSTLFYLIGEAGNPSYEWTHVKKSFNIVFEAMREILSYEQYKNHKYQDDFKFEIYADDLGEGQKEALIAVFKLFAKSHGLKFEISEGFKG